MPSGRPSVAAHSRQRCPAGVPGGSARSYRRSRNVASLGSRRARNSFGGRPPHASPYSALWPAAQMQRTICARLGGAGENGGHEVGELHPAGGGIEDVWRDLQAVPDLRPPPLRRVGAADRREVVAARACCAIVGDRRRLGRARVVLPQPRVRGEVLAPARDRSRAAAPRRRSAAASIPSCRRRCRSPGRARTLGGAMPRRAHR